MIKYTDYHKNILIDSEESSQHEMIIEALNFIDGFETSILNVIEDGNWKKYIENIKNYDKFLWECNHLHPQKTNPINILQNKKYSSYRETLLLPLWIRIKNSIQFETIVLINKPVIQTMFSDGSQNMKDVDGGLGIICDNKLLPVIINEDKSGHFCKTASKNVNGIMQSFKELNSNIITVCTTDNNVTIGKNIDAEVFSSINIIASLRNNNIKTKTYQDLNYNVFLELEKVIIKNLNSKINDFFDCKNYKIKKKQNKLVRESIDSDGIFINI
jgi:hypothetical protein